VFSQIQPEWAITQHHPGDGGNHGAAECRGVLGLVSADQVAQNQPAYFERAHQRERLADVHQSVKRELVDPGQAPLDQRLGQPAVRVHFGQSRAEQREGAPQLQRAPRQHAGPLPVPDGEQDVLSRSHACQHHRDQLQLLLVDTPPGQHLLSHLLHFGQI